MDGSVYVTKQAPSRARLSGLGRRQQFADVISLDPAGSASESGLANIWLMRTSFRTKSLAVSPAADERAWGFPFHADCWRIMEKLYSPAIPDVQFLLGFCRSFPVYLGIMNWGHDYGGSVRYEEKPAGLAPGEEAYLLPPAEGGPE